MSKIHITACSNPTIEIIQSNRTLSSALVREINNIWERKKATNGKIFNGQVFCVENFERNRMWGSFQEYKLLVAQYENPALFNDLKLTSLAVTGFFHWKSHILLGHRNSTVAQNQNQWELAPAGGLDPSSIDPCGKIVPLRTLAAEAKEELDIDLNSQDITPVPRLLIENLDDHVIDIVYFAEVDFEKIGLTDKLESFSNEEYDQITLTPLEKFKINSNQMQLNNLTKDCIQHVLRSPESYGL